MKTQVEESKPKTPSANHSNGGSQSVQLMQTPLMQRRAQEQADVINPGQRLPNRTGLPDRLKSGVEALSGYDMSDVRVHYNSSKPAQLNALAYAQGADIHVAPGQERHLPHEAWHVVQQKEGRVRPTLQMKGRININDDAGLEGEADRMGGRALQSLSGEKGGQNNTPDSPAQRNVSDSTERGNTPSLRSQLSQCLTIQKEDKDGELTPDEKAFLSEMIGKSDYLSRINFEGTGGKDKKTLKITGSCTKKALELKNLLKQPKNYTMQDIKGLLAAMQFHPSGSGNPKMVPKENVPLKYTASAKSIFDSQLHQSLVPKENVPPKFTVQSAQLINGIPINAEALKAIHHYVSTLKINESRHEDSHLTKSTHYQPTALKSFGLPHVNTVIDSPDLYEKYFASINQQLAGQGNLKQATTDLFKSLNSLGRNYVGLRLDRTGTTIKIVHYGHDEEVLLRTELEKRKEPYISTKVLQNSEIIKFLLDYSSYLSTLEKIGIKYNMTDEQIAEVLARYKKRVRTGEGDREDNYVSAIIAREEGLRSEEQLLVTHKGISIRGIEGERFTNSEEYYTEKYSINHFDLSPKITISQEKIKEITDYWRRAKTGTGKILLWGYAIAGFGDLGNFQMLYRSIVEQNPGIKERLEPYVCFYRYSIPDNLIDQLLHRDINVITHTSANRQWDPNYGYQVSQAVMPTDVTFEIQYNVGSVYNTAPKQNVLRVGEMGGMAGVSQVNNAYFTGTTRGGVGYGMPSQQEPEKNQDVTDFAHHLHEGVTGNKIASNLIDTIKEQYGLMMARENSQIVNQRPYYNNDEIDKVELRNISAGNRCLALILKGMLVQNNSPNPIILTTGNIDGLKEAAKTIGLEIKDSKSVDVNKSKYIVYNVQADAKTGYFVKGFFNNNYIHLIMKYAKTPTVYSGEGAMNEGLSYHSPGFMIPFYDFQVTLLIESGGIDQKILVEKSFIFDKERKKIFMDSISLRQLQKYDLIKIIFPSEEAQLYMVKAVNDRSMKIKKLDKPDVEFTIIFEKYLPTHEKLSFFAYKLKGWAQEWLNLIYDRNQNSIDIQKLGEQSKAIAGPNWFNLLK